MRKFQVKTEYWKTTMFFGKNTARLIQKTIKNILGVPITCHYEKYLGLPPIVCRSKYAAFAEIKKQVWKKL